MTHYGTWISYGGSARIGLAIGLLVVALAVTAAGIWLPLPAGARRPGRAVVTFMVAAWVGSIAAFGVGLAAYVVQVLHSYPGRHLAPADPVFPVTLLAVAGTFLAILITSPAGDGGWRRLTTAAVGAMAAPMIFELPFDLIVMGRTYPPVLFHPDLYRAVFFVPLFLVEITTLSLLTVSGMVKLSRGAFLAFAAMLAVFAVWGLAGFGYPSAPVPIMLNVVSKLLAFVTVLSLFLPQRARAGTRDSAHGPEPVHAIAAGPAGEVTPV